MAHRVLMELFPRPDDTPEYVWNEMNTGGSPSRVMSAGGKAWVSKLSASDSIHEYDTESDATTKMNELIAADSTNRRYKVVEV